MQSRGVAEEAQRPPSRKGTQSLDRRQTSQPPKVPTPSATGAEGWRHSSWALAVGEGRPRQAGEELCSGWPGVEGEGQSTGGCPAAFQGL